MNRNFILCVAAICVSCASAPTKPADANQGATRETNTFSMNYQVAVDINAAPEKVWGILTQIEAYPQWNSTITEISGAAEKNGKIRLKAKVAPEREFTLKVSIFEPPTKMVWEDGSLIPGMFKGVRTYAVENVGGKTRFTMVEVFSGAMLPMIKGSLPDFTSAFNDFARDLKTVAEKNR